MKLMASMISVAFLGFGLLAQAQFAPPQRYGPNDVSQLIQQVHTDLNHTYGGFRFTDDDRGRLNHAEKELREFSQKWNHGKFDKGELNDAIDSIQKVFNNNHISQVDRDAISNDLQQLRAMREAYNDHRLDYRH